MSDARNRLIKCFSAIFPSLSGEGVTQADITNTETWDSVAGVTLFALIEEEFGIEFDVQALGQLTSFKSILEYLEQNKHHI